MWLGAGLGKVQGRVFPIGHLGDFNDLMLAGTLEQGLKWALSQHNSVNKGGINAALDYFAHDPGP